MTRRRPHLHNALRSLAMLFAGGGLLSGCASVDPDARDRAVAARMAARAESANDAFINGDMRRWHGLVGPIAADFTLMQPSGGVSRGFDGGAAHLDRLARVFTRGDATLELVESYVTRDMLVLAFIERQRAVVAGLPEQDWSLRVTQVWRRSGSQWALVHRHADTLVEPMPIERAAALAGGGPDGR